MILSDKSISNLIKQGKLSIDFSPSALEIQCNHINLHLDKKLLRYTSEILDLKNPKVQFEEIIIPQEGYLLKPGEFLIGSTCEVVTIPNGFFGFIETKGNIARAGLQAHNTDGHIDPGFAGNITLEIKNNSNHAIVLYPHIPFVQIYFLQATSESLRPYNGKYQNQKGGTLYVKD
jgi:dCTP deaminase